MALKQQYYWVKLQVKHKKKHLKTSQLRKLNLLPYELYERCWPVSKSIEGRHLSELTTQVKGYLIFTIYYYSIGTKMKGYTVFTIYYYSLPWSSLTLAGVFLVEDQNVFILTKTLFSVPK